MKSDVQVHRCSAPIALEISCRQTSVNLQGKIAVCTSKMRAAASGAARAPAVGYDNRTLILH